MLRFTIRRACRMAGLLSFACAASAPLTGHAADVEVSEAWVRGTAAAQKATGAFMTLKSKEGATVTGAASPVAGVVELHEMKTEGGVMRMRATPKLDLPAGKAVALQPNAPGGYHVMLMDLKKPLTKGDIVPVTLKIQGKDGKQDSVEIKAEVRALTAAMEGHEHHHH